MRPLSLRLRLAAYFAVAVTAALALFGAAVAVVVVQDEAEDSQPGHVEDEHEDLERVLLAMGVVSPFAIAGAVGLGVWLSRRSLEPLRQASDRARQAQHSVLELTLPVTGSGDEWDELATTLNALLASTRSSVERIRHFTADAAHELRTPLTTLIGEAELALRRERPPEELRRALEVALDEGRRLATLVDRLLLLARADSGRLALAPTRLDLHELAEQVAARVRRGPASGAAIAVSGEEAFVRGDRELLGQLLFNLLDNAVRHGGGVVSVEVRRQSGRGQVMVRDHGPGIPATLAPVVFERFTRAEASRTSAGHGLGLSIAAAVAQAHGGSLALASDVGPGACFVLDLHEDSEQAPASMKAAGG